MANEKFDPSKPLDAQGFTKEDEEDCHREAKARARLRYLSEHEYAAEQPAPKKRKGVFSRD